MQIFKRLFTSSIGKKILMAVTGILIILFLAGHLLGNLQIFVGQDAINSYAAFLKKNAVLVWFVRLAMLSIFLLHIRVAIQLKIENRAARPVAYAKPATLKATFASRTMILSGLVILSFVVYHLLHYTLGIVHSGYFHLRDSLGRHDVYSMVVLSFREPVISASYIVSVFLVALHLRHAIPGFFQTLGWNGGHLRIGIELIGMLLSLVFFIGYASIPVSILFNLINLPGEVL